MKDPLQRQPTPYEILGVARDASAAQINDAFRSGLMKRGNVQKLTAAKVSLERPVERAIVDLLHYDNAVLARLTPDPREDVSVLDGSRRGATAAAWEAMLRRSFPDSGIAHALGVLWYWWAHSESERLVAGPSSDSAPQPRALWRNAIGCFATVIGSDEFWRRQEHIARDLIPAVQSALRERVISDLHRLAQTGGPHADALQKLELTFKTELETTRVLAAANIRANRERLACGTVMLERMNQLDKVRHQVAAALARAPDNKALAAVQDALSPLAGITAALQLGQFQAVLDEIRQLPVAERESAPFKRLELRALQGRGRQEASLGNVAAALDLWKRALERAASDAERKAVQDELVDTAQSSAAALQNKPDDAIKILESALAITPSQKLELTLAEILAAHAMRNIHDVYKRVEKGDDPTPAMIASVATGTADLERAAKLGSRRAEEAVPMARRFHQMIVVGTSHGGTSSAYHWERELAARTNRQDWDGAIEVLRRAFQHASHGSQEERAAQKRLATMLVVSATASLDAADQAGSAAGVKAVLDKAVAQLLEAGQLDPQSNDVAESLRKAERLRKQLEMAELLLRAQGRLARPDASVPREDRTSNERAPQAHHAAPAGKHTERRHVAHSLWLLALWLLPLVTASALSSDTVATFDIFLRLMSTGWIGATAAALASILLLAGVLSGCVGWGPRAVTVICVRWRHKRIVYRWFELAIYICALTFSVSAVGYSTATPQAASSNDATSGLPEASARLDTTAFTSARLAATLQTIGSFQVPAARSAAGALSSMLQQIPAEVVPAAKLCLAVAHERAGEQDRARTIYQELAAGTPGALQRSAELPLAELTAKDTEQREAAYEALADKSAGEGYFRINGAWMITDSRRAALSAIMSLRSQDTSVRLFDFLRSHSVWVPAYAYLFILLILALAVKVLQLPLLVASARMSIVTPRVRSEYARLKSKHEDDRAALASAVNELYRRHGLNPAAGCLRSFLDVAFVVWVMLTLRRYAPQLSLDDASFMWVADVTQRDAGTLAMWIVASLLSLLLIPQLEARGAGIRIASALVMLAVVAAVAWFWGWPAYLMIFWTMLSLLSAVIQLLLTGLLATR